jgi:hypothetical protein
MSECSPLANASSRGLSAAAAMGVVDSFTSGSFDFDMDYTDYAQATSYLTNGGNGAAAAAAASGSSSQCLGGMINNSNAHLVNSLFAVPTTPTRLANPAPAPHNNDYNGFMVPQHPAQRQEHGFLHIPNAQTHNNMYNYNRTYHHPTVQSAYGSAASVASSSRRPVYQEEEYKQPARDTTLSMRSRVQAPPAPMFPQSAHHHNNRSIETFGLNLGSSPIDFPPIQEEPRNNTQEDPFESKGDPDNYVGAAAVSIAPGAGSFGGSQGGSELGIPTFRSGSPHVATFGERAGSPSGSVSSINSPTDNRTTSSKSSRTVVACVSCHQAKAKCDTERPCRRCVKMGKGAECLDRPHKSRARVKGDKQDSAQQKSLEISRKFSQVLSQVWLKSCKSVLEQAFQSNDLAFYYSTAQKV